MPIYEYECMECGHIKEAWQRFSDKPLRKCDLCGSRLKKLISQSTFHLKGSGWYVTDYASKPKAEERKPEKAEKKEGKAKESKSEKKESAKSTSKKDAKD